MGLFESLTRNRRATIYDYLDIVVPVITIFFIFIFMYANISFAEDIVENEYIEKRDQMNGHLLIMNLMRTDLAEVVPNIEKFPEETRDMNFASFFSWYAYNDLPDENLNNLKIGVDKVLDGSKYIFSDNYGWNIKVRKDGKTIYDQDSHYKRWGWQRQGTFSIVDDITKINLPTQEDNIEVVLYVLFR